MVVDLRTSFGEISETPSIFPREEGEVEVIVTNQGDSTFTGSADLAVYASTNSTLEKGDLNIDEEGFLDNLKGQDEVLTGQSSNDTIGTITIDALNLAPGESETVNLDFSSSDLRTPSVIAPGAYYLISEIDPNNSIRESNNGNNRASQFISTDGSNVVQDWNSVFLNAVQASGADSYGFSSPSAGSGDGTIPPVVPRNAALLHTAIFDTVVAFEGGFEPFAVDEIAPSGASVEAAVVGAAFTILSSEEVYSEQTPDFIEQRERSLAEIDADDSAKSTGFEFGIEVAEELLELRDSDFAVPPSEVFEPTNQPGAWRPIIDGEPQNPEGPQFESVPPFFIPSTQQFRTDGPPQFGSPRFASETEETRLLGGLEDTEITKITRTDEETEIAQFWSFDRTDTFRPPGHWNLIAQQAILQSQESGEELSLVDTARLFAQLNIALTDAGVVSWDSKFDFVQLRPEQTINADPRNEVPSQPGGVDFDGNPTSVEDPNWDPLIGTPPFPDYTSGHAAFGGAASEVLESYFGSDFDIEITTQDIPGLSRSFGSFSQAAAENGDSRVFGGIHIISSSLEGLESGENIGQFVVDNALSPTDIV
ncbi:MAG: CARDB domain-containing protein [Cyanobacteria bacterium P01_A01_bin.83]